MASYPAFSPWKGTAEQWADAILISGPRQAVEPDLDMLAQVREALDGKVPVFANTGAKATNVATFVDVADGIIVGSDLKRDGYTWNEVDAGRVQDFMKAAGRSAERRLPT